MKINKILLYILLFLLSSCSEQVPNNFGIYISSNKELINLNLQKAYIKGNLIESISGLNGSSGACFNKFDYLIVFEQNLNPSDIKISKLEFKKGVTVKNIFGNSYVEVNLWTSEKVIAINVEPVKGKKDMYKIYSTTQLDTGFYALHFGALTNKETPDAFNKVAYDFVIGTSIAPYQSFKDAQIKNESSMTNKAEKLLILINEYFNNKNYSDLHKIYLKPDGSIFNDIEWKSMVEGFTNWHSQSGKIKSSLIIDKNITNNISYFSIQTEYEKAGLVKEELQILKRGDSCFITFIGSK